MINDTNYIPNKAKKIINWYKQPDSWFWVYGSINPYRGCEHACKYCDGMSDFYRIDNFDKKIRIKDNSHTLLRKELISKGIRHENSLDSFFDQQVKTELRKQEPISKVLSIGGGVCDIYQPAEIIYGITRKILKVIREFNYPITILTKSLSIIKDLDILKEISKNTFVNICFSITLFDESTQKLFEPNSSSTQERFDTLKEIRNSGIHGGIIFMPIIPGIGDTEENINEIMKSAKKSKAEYIVGGGLTIKSGKSRQNMFKIIEKNYPHLLDIYKYTYQEKNKYGTPKVGKILNSAKILNQFAKKYNLPDRMPRYIPNNNYQELLIFSTLLQNLAYYRQYIEGQSFYKTRKLAAAANLAENTFSFRDLNLPNREIEALTNDFLKTGKISELDRYTLPIWPIYFKE